MKFQILKNILKNKAMHYVVPLQPLKSSPKYEQLFTHSHVVPNL